MKKRLVYLPKKADLPILYGGQEFDGHIPDKAILDFVHEEKLYGIIWEALVCIWWIETSIRSFMKLLLNLYMKKRLDGIIRYGADAPAP